MCKLCDKHTIVFIISRHTITAMTAPQINSKQSFQGIGGKTMNKVKSTPVSPQNTDHNLIVTVRGKGCMFVGVQYVTIKKKVQVGSHD